MHRGNQVLPTKHHPSCEARWWQNHAMRVVDRWGLRELDLGKYRDFLYENLHLLK